MARDRSLRNLVLLFAACSLVHFAHNAEFLADYPNLPETWTRSGVYVAWVGLSATGLAGWLAFSSGYRKIGLSVLVVYALLGIDSLGHYRAARVADHTFLMNLTIVLEVGTATLLLVVVLYRLYRQIVCAGAGECKPA